MLTRRFAGFTWVVSPATGIDLQPQTAARIFIISALSQKGKRPLAAGDILLYNKHARAQMRAAERVGGRL